MTVTQRGTPVLAATPIPGTTLTPSVQGTWGGSQTRTAGDLLVAVVTAYGNTTATLGAAPAHWAQLTTITAASTTVTAVYCAVAAGSDTAPTFTATMTGTTTYASLTVTLYDLSDSSGVTPCWWAQATSTGTSGTLAVGPSDNAAVAGSFAIAASMYSNGTTLSGTVTWTTPTSWTLGVDQLAAGYSHTASYYYAAPPTGTLSVTFTHSGTSSEQSAALFIAAPPASSKMATLTDNFSTNDLGTVWGASTSGSYAPVISNNVCAIQTGGAAAAGIAIAPNQNYDLSASAIYARIRPPLPDPSAEREAIFFLDDGQENSHSMFYGYDNGSLSVLIYDANTTIGPITTTYNAVTHAWLRVRESSGTLYFDTAPDGLTWTNYYSTGYSVPVTNMWPNLQVSYHSTDTSSSVAYVQNVSVPGPSAAFSPVNLIGMPQNTHTATQSSGTPAAGTWGTGQTTTAGDLLLAVVSAAASTSAAATALGSGTTGWVNQLEIPNSGTAHARVAIWTKTAAGADAAPTFYSTETGTAGGMDITLYEFSGANVTAPIAASGTYASGSSTGTLSAMTATTTANTTLGGCYALSAFAQERAAASLTWTDSGAGGFNTVINGNGVSAVLQTYIGELPNPAAGTTVTDTGAFSTDTTAYGAGLVIVLAPAPAIVDRVSVTTTRQAIKRASLW